VEANKTKKPIKLALKKADRGIAIKTQTGPAGCCVMTDWLLYSSCAYIHVSGGTTPVHTKLSKLHSYTYTYTYYP
jgi:hypothetical protein